MNGVRLALLALAAMLPASCAAQPQASADTAATAAEQDPVARHPVSGLELIDVTIRTSDEAITFVTELADTPDAQAQGLMFRTELGDLEAMLFPSDRPQVRSFWMKNTPLPLDIIFIGEDGRILNIAANTVPYSLDSVRSDGPAIAVFEIRGGRSAALGIEAGDAVQWEFPE